VADPVGEYVISLVVRDGKIQSIADEVSVIVDTILIYENDFSGSALSDFLVGEEGDAQVSIDQGELKISPGAGYQNRGYVALDLPGLSAEYPATLVESDAKIIWAFNVSNVDGAICGACNNLFYFKIYSDPDPSAPTGLGYSLMGGGFAGSRVLLSQEASALSPVGPIFNAIVDLSDGLETLPTIGAFRLEYEPITSIWELYYEESTTPLDPREITTWVGSGINTGFVSEQLPYLILGSENEASASFDNVSVILKFSI
jgi:hypothetical protein